MLITQCLISRLSQSFRPTLSSQTSDKLTSSIGLSTGCLVTDYSWKPAVLVDTLARLPTPWTPISLPGTTSTLESSTILPALTNNLNLMSKDKLSWTMPTRVLLVLSAPITRLKQDSGSSKLTLVRESKDVLALTASISLTTPTNIWQVKSSNWELTAKTLRFKLPVTLAKKPSTLLLMPLKDREVGLMPIPTRRQPKFALEIPQDILRDFTRSIYASLS